MKPDKTTVDYLKTYLVMGNNPAAKKQVLPKDITRLIFNYVQLEDWMKTANDLAEFLKSPSLTFITRSELWNNDPTLTKAKAWLVNPVAPYVDELDTFYKETIQPLVQFLATCKLVDSTGTTPLMWAAGYGHTESVEAMLAVLGTDVNAKNKYGRTALIFAAWEGHTESVKALLGMPGIDVNAKNKHDCTALMYAQEFGHTECRNLIHDHLSQLETQAETQSRYKRAIL